MRQTLRDALARYRRRSPCSRRRDRPLGLLPPTRDRQRLCRRPCIRAGARRRAQRSAVGSASARTAKSWPPRRFHFEARQDTRRRPYRLAAGSAQRDRAARHRRRRQRRRGAAAGLAARRSAASASSRRRNGESQQPLLSDVYYLERALSPYAEIAQGHHQRSCWTTHVSVLMLADVGKIAGADHDAVAKIRQQRRRADPFRRRAHDRRRRRSGAGEAARRRALSGQRHGLGGAAASGAVRRHSPVQRPGRFPPK